MNLKTFKCMFVIATLVSSSSVLGSVCDSCPRLCPKDINAGPAPRVSWEPFWNCIDGEDDVPLVTTKDVYVQQCCRSDYGTSATLWGQAYGGSYWYCDYDQYTNQWYTGQDQITCECFKEQKTEFFFDDSQVEASWSGSVDITKVGTYPLELKLKWKGTPPADCSVHAVGEEATLTLNIHVTEALGQGCDPVPEPPGSNDVPFFATQTTFAPPAGSSVSETHGTYDETQSWVLRSTSGWGTCGPGIELSVEATLGVGLNVSGSIPGLANAIEGGISVNAETTFSNTWPCNKPCMRSKVQVYQRKLVREYSGTCTTYWYVGFYSPPPTTAQVSDTATIWPNVLPKGNGNVLGNCCYSVNAD